MSSQPGNAFAGMGREDLLLALEMFAENWLADDGCWFLAAEERFDMETAIDWTVAPGNASPQRRPAASWRHSTLRPMVDLKRSKEP